MPDQQRQPRRSTISRQTGLDGACSPARTAVAAYGPEQAGVPDTPGHRRNEQDGLVIDQNLPDNLPILSAEIDLLRLYFADLLDDVLKAPK